MNRLIFCALFFYVFLLFPNIKLYAQSCENVSSRIVDGQSWIVNAQRDNGLFHYEYLPLEDKFTDDDNIVRQVGTFWSLVNSLDHSKNEKAVKAINKFRKKINTLVVRKTANDKDIAFIKFDGIGKLNTSALYVLSLLSLKEHGFKLTDQEASDLPLFINGLRLMSDEQGGFWYIYFLAKKQNIISSYGSGEAIFALAKYYDHINDIDGLKWSYEEFNKYYDRFLKHKTDFKATEARGFFSWGIYALAIINKKFPIKYEETIKPLLNLAFNERKLSPICKDKGCLAAENLGDSPFFEGVIQAYKMALLYENDETEIKKIRMFISLALKDFTELQIIDMPKFRKKYNFTGKEKNVRGAFCWDKNCYQIRNDMTQHVISALIYYSDQFCQK
jgi:hypothetical protein